MYGLITLSQAVQKLSECDSAVWCYEKGGVPMAQLGLKSGSEIGLLIGSEGGFPKKKPREYRRQACSPWGWEGVYCAAKLLRWRRRR